MRRRFIAKTAMGIISNRPAHMSNMRSDLAQSAMSLLVIPTDSPTVPRAELASKAALPGESAVKDRAMVVPAQRNT